MNSAAQLQKEILVIEDDQDIRETVKTILELEGYQVLTAVHGKDGIELLTSRPQLPNLILLDLMMPVMSGWEFLETIQRDHKDTFGKIPVVVVSAAGDSAKTKAFSVAEFMKKPVDIDALLASVARYLSN